jgi:hypothetical protein
VLQSSSSKWCRAAIATNGAHESAPDTMPHKFVLLMLQQLLLLQLSLLTLPTQ